MMDLDDDELLLDEEELDDDDELLLDDDELDDDDELLAIKDKDEIKI